MEALKNKWRDLPLRRFFILTVFLCAGIVVLLSALIIGGCVSFRHWLLPDSNAVYLTIEQTLEDGTVTQSTHLMKYGEDMHSLPQIKMESDGVSILEKVKKTEYSIQKIENSFDMLSPKRKLAYQICGITMAAAPAVLAFLGIILCSMYFYRKKLRRPLELLSRATDEIAKKNLDFAIIYDCNDELGRLCHSFEKMREALYENNKAMWEMLEERRLMQASVAHDLRNPIAIIKGYTEYLESSLENGAIGKEKLCHIVRNLNMAAKRLEQYTESVRILNRLEEAKVDRKPVWALEMAESIAEDMRLLAEQNEIVLQVTKHLENQKIQADFVLIYRILENIMNNALRYAKKEICLDFTLSENIFSITITDDGEGFLPEIQKQKEKTLFSFGKDGHMGIGLAVSKRLCEKHGGSMELYNTGGACVKINLSV